jgi:hypothetical protein
MANTVIFDYAGSGLAKGIAVEIDRQSRYYGDLAKNLWSIAQ